MAYYLTIPDVTDAEELLSFHLGPIANSFSCAVKPGATADRLFRAANDGTLFPRVDLVVDDNTIAMYDVLVDSASFIDPVEPELIFTLHAGSVRYP